MAACDAMAREESPGQGQREVEKEGEIECLFLPMRVWVRRHQAQLSLAAQNSDIDSLSPSVSFPGWTHSDNVKLGLGLMSRGPRN